MAEARKTVTVVFADVSGSTELGERLDAEALRRVMERHFAVMRQALERHGGTVEKFIGDAVMAVFGIPAAHEDDALRAVKAAAEIRARLHELNLELEVELGVSLAIRTGINTGEVVAGDPASGQFYATGDAVNVAARFEQAAEPGTRQTPLVLAAPASTSCVSVRKTIGIASTLTSTSASTSSLT
jgi:class 3 adenylate cyclase